MSIFARDVYAIEQACAHNQREEVNEHNDPDLAKELAAIEAVHLEVARLEAEAAHLEAEAAHLEEEAARLNVTDRLTDFSGWTDEEIRSHMEMFMKGNGFEW